MKIDAEAFGATVGVGAEGELTSITSDAGTTRGGAEGCAAECTGGGVPASIQTVGELWGAASTGGGCVAEEIPSGRDGSSSTAAGRSASSSAPWVVEGGIEIGCAAEDAADADDDLKMGLREKEGRYSSREAGFRCTSPKIARQYIAGGP